MIKPAAQKKPIMSRSTFRAPKIAEKITLPNYCLINIQRRPCTSTKGIKTMGVERVRLSELATQAWGDL